MSTEPSDAETPTTSAESTEQTGAAGKAPNATISADPLRGSRTSAIWFSMVLLVVVLGLLAIFVLQNTQQVEVAFLGWRGTAPLAASLLIATAAGLLLAVAAGTLRILQLRRRVRRDRRH